MASTWVGCRSVSSYFSMCIDLLLVTMEKFRRRCCIGSERWRFVFLLKKRLCVFFSVQAVLESYLQSLVQFVFVFRILIRSMQKRRYSWSKRNLRDVVTECRFFGETIGWTKDLIVTLYVITIRAKTLSFCSHIWRGILRAVLVLAGSWCLQTSSILVAG